MKQKFLCLCENGNNRSVFMAYRLKRNGHEALATGWRVCVLETLVVLCDWADVVIVMQAGFEQKLPERYRSKAFCVDVGPDKWGPRWASEMKQIIYAGYDRLKEQGIV